MVEKYSATQTQVATKVSTKTKVLLGLVIAGCLGGMFAIASMSLKTQTSTKEQIPTINFDSIRSPKVAGVGEDQTGYKDAGQSIRRPGNGTIVCMCSDVLLGDHNCDCNNGCSAGWWDQNGVYHETMVVPCTRYKVIYTPMPR